MFKWSEEKKTRLKAMCTKDNMIILVLMGVLLMVIALPMGNQKEDSPAGVTADGEEASENPEGKTAAVTLQNTEENEYAAVLENKLEQVLSCMDGVGEVKVIVTMRASREKVTLKDNPGTSSKTQETDAEGGTRDVISQEKQEVTVYTTDEEGNQVPYVIKTLEPSVEGVFVVAGGGGEPVIQKNITEAIQALFNIEPHKIKVVKMNQVTAKGKQE